ncbi:MAG: hypothetical protein ACUVTG_10040 [Candidatus Oleimicrobiaceae bacterium]
MPVMLLVLDNPRARRNGALATETPYERHNRTLQDQLYGVDVMDRAVRVAELRLWVQLAVELAPAELRFRPLLPELKFKLRLDDSLPQAVGDLDLSPSAELNSSSRPMSKGASRNSTAGSDASTGESPA